MAFGIEFASAKVTIRPRPSSHSAWRDAHNQRHETKRVFDLRERPALAPCARVGHLFYHLWTEPSCPWTHPHSNTAMH